MSKGEYGQKFVDANLSKALAYFSKSLFAMSDICSIEIYQLMPGDGYHASIPSL
jgi:hypothetical protein